ncbi:hypothetical protein CYY_006042 [Polysphondylium violaceum]|uniref:Paired amphipathic helix containing protein n=1 Tax=Polysphondylium violaceum TaxID=133409 RepID=A0A8J4PRG6_9MYCE|nr:hypothetical protein CYY_006042 [Polysphondylium violaceum]
MIHSNKSNTREDLEKDNERLQKENWELKNYFKVGYSNTVNNSLYFQLETSNLENDKLKQENKAIKQHLKKLSEENDNHNNKMDILFNKIESLANINDKLNIRIENYSNKMDLLSEKIESMEEAIDTKNTNIDYVNLENLNNKIDLLLNKIESIERVNEKLLNTPYSPQHHYGGKQQQPSPSDIKQPPQGQLTQQIHQHLNQLIQIQQQHLQQQNQQQQKLQQLQQLQLASEAAEKKKALEYVKKVKDRFSEQPNNYKQFLKILNNYHKESQTIREVYEKVTELFSMHRDLLDEFTQFLPKTAASVPPTQPTIK